tara:strand:+ start:784 stop:2148 length:1365 start_codon:yes stop_codon:yes gene_type:complete
MDIKIGQKFVKQKEFTKALDFFLKISDKKKNNSTVNFYLGLIYSELNDFKKSVEYYEKCLDKDPKSFYTLYNLAIVKQNIGEINQAKEIYLKLIEMDKFKIRPYLGLYTLNPKFINDIHYKNILEIEKNLEITDYEKSLISFILSKIEKRKKNIKKELEYLNNFHDLCFNSNHQYNLQSEFYYKKIINIFYNKIKFINYKKNDSFLSEFSPIFIIGLPRSGSTLIESILTSADEKIQSCGESHVINMSVVSEVANKIYDKKFEFKNFNFEVNYLNLEKNISEKYKKLKVLNHPEKIFIDKSLENFFNLELILNFFPNAKFIHTTRNLNDSILAIYQSLLFELSWTHKIKDIIIYIDNYLKILNFFKKKYKSNILNVSLEELTREKEKVSREIFNFCKLKWNKEILNFYNRKDLFIKTLSGNQVRQKIFTYEDKKYEPYYYLIKKFENDYSWINL